MGKINKKIFLGLPCGFTIIESLIYIFCGTLLLLVTSNFISNNYQSSLSNVKNTDRYFEIFKSHDYVISHLQTAPIDKALWKQLETNEIIWHCNQKNKDISF